MQAFPKWLTRDLLAHRATITPSETALTDPKRELSVSFQSFDTIVDRIATVLKDTGVKPGTHVGVAVSNRTEFILLAHALTRISAVIVPLNREFNQQSLNQYISHADITFVVVSEQSTVIDSEFPLGVFSINNSLQNPELSLDQERTTEMPAASDPGERYALMFTSGTTGPPKIVSLTKQNLVMNAIAAGFRLGFTEAYSWLCCLPMYHMGGFAPIIRSLIYGNELVIQQQFDIPETLHLIDTHEITGLSVVPTMIHRFLDTNWTPPSHLQIVLVGGAPLTPPLRQRCQEIQLPIFPTYGLTETASQITTAPPQMAFTHQGTSGNPILFTDVTILDSAMTPVDAGQHGQIAVDGPTVTNGYYANPSANKQSFSKNGFLTGDTGYLDQHGRLWVTGRVNDEIITGGKNVDPQEIKSALETHPEVHEAFVIGIADEEWGERIGAVVVPHDSPSREELTDHCRNQLANFKVPRIIKYTNSLPHTKSGTVDREAIKAILKQ